MVDLMSTQDFQKINKLMHLSVLGSIVKLKNFFES